MKRILRAWWLFLVIAAIAFLPQMAYATEVTMGSGGNLIFEPSEITISAGDTVTFVNGELPPHNMIVKVAFMGGESFEVTFPESGDYEFQCDPHAGAGMKGVIHVQ